MVSVIPSGNATPNPHFGKAAFFVEKNGDFQNIARDVQKMLRGGATRAEVKIFLANTKLKQLFNDFKALQPSGSVIPPPPPTSTIYGRFSKGAKIFDVGSGNGMKLKKYTGRLNITANDVTDLLPTGLCPIRIGPLSTFFPLDTNFLYTSFMSFCQLSREEQRSLVNVDGIHMVPNHGDLVKSGSAVFTGEHYDVVTPTRIYRDNIINAVVSPVTFGYGVVQCYRERNIKISVDHNVIVSKQVITVDATPISYLDININDISCKIDGVPYEIERYKGKLYYTGRNGNIYTGECDSDTDFCIHVEKCDEFYVLIRVVYFGDMIPFHSLDCLRLFVTRVKMKIDGKPLFAPPDWKKDYAIVGWNCREDTFAAPIDGIITRIEQKDFYVKFEWTFDFKSSDVTKLIEEATDYGFVVQAPEIVDGLHEYMAVRNDGHVLLKPMRPRPDKTTTTSIKTALHMLTQMTINEAHCFETQ